MGQNHVINEREGERETEQQRRENPPDWRLRTRPNNLQAPPTSGGTLGGAAETTLVAASSVSAGRGCGPRRKGSSHLHQISGGA